MPQLIKPITPTSAGAAQVFDVSGVRDYMEQKQREKDAKINQLLIEYDTKGVFKRDIPEVQRRVRDVQQFAMQNAEALMNPSENLETYQKFQDLQRDVKNLITYSTAAKEQFNTATKMYMNGSNGMYLTPQNKERLYQYAQTPTASQYADYSAFEDPMLQFNRNYDIDPQKYAKSVSFRPTGYTETGNMVAGDVEVKQGSEIDNEATDAKLKAIWNSQSLESSSLHDIYKTYDAFKEEAIAMAQNPEEYGLVSPPVEKEAKDKTAAQMKAEAAVMFRQGSGFSMIETKYDPETQKPYRSDVRDSEGRRKDAVDTYGVMTAGQSMTFYPDLRIQKNVDIAYDMTTGNMLQPGEGKRYKYQIPVERSKYMTANAPFTITYKNEEGKKVTNRFEKGEAVPDLEAMKKAGTLDKNEYNKSLGKVSATDGYIVYASNEKLDYFDLAPGEDVINMLEGKGGRFLMVPAWSISHDVDQQLSYKHGMTQAQYVADREATSGGYDYMGGMQ